MIRVYLVNLDFEISTKWPTRLHSFFSFKLVPKLTSLDIPQVPIAYKGCSQTMNQETFRKNVDVELAHVGYAIDNVF